MLPGFAFFDFFKGRDRGGYRVTDELLNHPLKNKYFHRHIPYSNFDESHVVAFDKDYPRTITFDDWPQIIFLNATGRKTIYQFTLEMARGYKGRVPNGLERTIIEETEKLIAEKIIAIADEEVILPGNLLYAMKSNK